MTFNQWSEYVVEPYMKLPPWLLASVLYPVTTIILLVLLLLFVSELPRGESE